MITGLPHLDRQHIKALAEIDGGKVVASILNYLCDDIVRLHEDFAALSPLHDGETIGFLAHSLLGAALQAGAPRLAQAARELEAASIANNLSQEMVDRLIVTAQQTRLAIIAFVSEADLRSA